MTQPGLIKKIIEATGMTDSQACKAALSDPDTLTYDQVL